MTSASNFESPALLFVYGTLRADVRHPLHDIIRTNARDLGPAVFQGRLYDFGEYPGVVDSDRPADRVFGEVYEIVGDVALVLERLDAYEECGPAFAEPTEYLREIRPVRLTAPIAPPLPAGDPDETPAGETAARERSGSGTTLIKAWIYLYNHSLHGARHMPHGDYLGKKSR